MNIDEPQISKIWSRASGVFTRFGYVVYGGAFIFITLAAVASLLDSSNDGIAMPLFYSGLSAVGVVLFLELVRRVLMYVIAGEKIFRRQLPLVGKLSFALTLLLIFSALPVYLFYDLPKEAREHEEAQTAYRAALNELPQARAAAEICKEDLANKPKPESPACRRERLGYEACLETLASRTSCLSIWDYESACNDKWANLFSSDASCYSRVKELESTVSNYEANYGRE